MIFREDMMTNPYFKSITTTSSNNGHVNPTISDTATPRPIGVSEKYFSTTKVSISKIPTAILGLTDATGLPTADIVSQIPTSTTPRDDERYIYDFYSDIDVIKTLVSIVSIIFLVTALFFWGAVWCGSPYGHPYRFASFIAILGHSLLYHTLSLITLLVYVPNGFGCQTILTLKSYADIGMYIFFFVFVILCIGVAMRRLESGGHFYIVIILAMILPLILVTATTTFRVLRHSVEHCDLLDELIHALWFDRAPKSFLLFGTICVLAVLLYWLFCFDNSNCKMKRDFLLMQHSSVTLMILVCFCFFLELYEIVFMNQSPDGHIKTKGIARNGLVISILMCAKGSIAAFLLCFFDVEVLTMMFSLPCCPNLDEAVDDRNWEKKIRSDSKVKFFEESSSDDSYAGGGIPGRMNPFDQGKEENDHVLPSIDNFQSYGSVRNK